MKKVKLFVRDVFDDNTTPIDEQINEFLQKENKQLVDIKFECQLNTYFVILIYE